jgi:hypothetical protein
VRTEGIIRRSRASARRDSRRHFYRFWFQHIFFPQTLRRPGAETRPNDRLNSTDGWGSFPSSRPENIMGLFFVQTSVSAEIAAAWADLPGIIARLVRHNHPLNTSLKMPGGKPLVNYGPPAPAAGEFEFCNIQVNFSKKSPALNDSSCYSITN